MWQVISVAAGEDNCLANRGVAIAVDDTTVRFGDVTFGTSGCRFLAVSAPQGATITTAHISFRGSSTLSGATCNVRIYGEDVDDSTAFSTIGDFDGRTLTTASVDWDAIAAWSETVWYKSPSLVTIVQEIVDRALWVAGNSMTFIWDDNSSSANAYRFASSHSTGNPPKLVIGYTP